MRGVNAIERVIGEILSESGVEIVGDAEDVAVVVAGVEAVSVIEEGGRGVRDLLVQRLKAIVVGAGFRGTVAEGEVCGRAEGSVVGAAQVVVAAEIIDIDVREPIGTAEVALYHAPAGVGQGNLVSREVVAGVDSRRNTRAAGSLGRIQRIQLKGRSAREPADGVRQGDAPPIRLIVVVANCEARGVGFAGQAIERVIAVANRNVASIRLAGQIAVGVVAIRDGAGFGIGGAGELRERIVIEGALTGAVLHDAKQIIEGVVSVGRVVVKASRVFPNGGRRLPLCSCQNKKS